MLVRREGHVLPLTPLYDSPYKVLQRSLRTFRLQIGNKQELSPPEVSKQYRRIQTCVQQSRIHGGHLRKSPVTTPGPSKRVHFQLPPVVMGSRRSPRHNQSPVVSSLRDLGGGYYGSPAYGVQTLPPTSQQGVSLFDRLPSCWFQLTVTPLYCMPVYKHDCVS